MRTVASAIVLLVWSFTTGVIGTIGTIGTMGSIATVGIFGLGGCAPPETEHGAGTGVGKTLFDQTCARCHAADGKGDPTAKAQLGVPDMSDPAWQGVHPDDVIKRTVREGSKSKKMPPFGTIYSDAQLDAIIAYVRTFRTGAK